ncbi:MAG TPA: methyltransferase domain-containing protein [Candidatus Limnocylindrales bacterium]|nr:methyltransferase domain-containing protein [Candidatus Limnocylindrales bacterium]
MAWNAAQYLKFGQERTRPSRDLATRVGLADPRRVIDLGCGPGNSTAVLRERWPHAAIRGLDSSPEMIAAARAGQPECEWEIGDIASWAADGEEKFDVVFSNAALQWLPRHETLLPRLLGRVAPGGAFAMQIPANPGAVQDRILRDMARGPAQKWDAQSAAFYYDVLAGCGARVDMWTTTYYHLLPNVEAIAEWYKGTAMRPYLDALPDDDARTEFFREYTERLRPHFPPQADGTVLFPFQRLFAIAYCATSESDRV